MKLLFSGLPELCIVAFLTLIGGDTRFSAVLAAALIHEAGHIIAAVGVGAPFRFCRTGIAGITLRYDTSQISPAKEALICASGPATGLVFAAAGALIWHGAYFTATSLALSVFNLLPVSQLDGGGIVSSLLSVKLPPDTVWHIMRVLSFVFTLAIWCAAVAALVVCGNNISSMCASVYLLYRIFSEY